MNVILPYGTFFETDPEGYIVNPTALSHIDAAFLPLIAAAQECFLRHHADRLHAVYLRGSIPRGMATASIADQDIVGILEPQPGREFVRWAKPDWADAEEAILLARFPFVAHIDFAVADRDADYPGRNAALKCLLKTQGLCLWGRDDSVEWPRYKADREAAFQYRWLATDLEAWRQGFAPKAASAEKWAFLCAFAKTTLRAGMELVMERSGKYAVDLYPCMTEFGAHYPAHATLMRAALHSYLNPEDARPDATLWIESVVPFLITEAQLLLASPAINKNS